MKVEYYSNKPFKIVSDNPLVGPTEDMDDIEFWETRLTKLDISFAVAYEQVSDKIKYYIFVKDGKIS